MRLAPAALIAAICIALPAHAQRQPAFQDGIIMPNHLVKQGPDGLLKDAGGPAIGDAVGQGVSPFGVNDKLNPLGIATYSADPTVDGSYIALGHNAAGVPTITVGAVGGASAPGCNFDINGVIVPCVGGLSGAQTVINDHNPTLDVAGYNPGCRIMIGTNQTGTPGAGDAVGCTMYVDNLNGRGFSSHGIWNINLLNLMAVGGNDTTSRNIEAEFNNLGAAPTDPFSGAGGARKTSYECVGHGSSTANPTACWWSWAASATTSTWPNFGMALSRNNLVGLYGADYPGDTTTFSRAFIQDNSNSPRVLMIGNTHSNIIDMSTMTNTSGVFVKMPATFDSNLLIKNYGDFVTGITIDSGNGAIKAARLRLSDNGTAKWSVLKNNGNDFGIFNEVTGFTSIAARVSDDLVTIAKSAVVTGALTVAGLPASAGAGGINVCVDTAGVFYKKASCP